MDLFSLYTVTREADVGTGQVSGDVVGAGAGCLVTQVNDVRVVGDLSLYVRLLGKAVFTFARTNQEVRGNEFCQVVLD